MCSPDPITASKYPVAGVAFIPIGPPHKVVATSLQPPEAFLGVDGTDLKRM